MGLPFAEIGVKHGNNTVFINKFFEFAGLHLRFELDPTLECTKAIGAECN